MIPDNIKAEIIKWVDSYSMHDIWVDLDSLNPPKLNVCISIGYVIYETNDSVQLVSNISDIENPDDKGMGNGFMTIPKVSIINRNVIALEVKN